MPYGAAVPSIDRDGARALVVALAALVLAALAACEPVESTPAATPARDAPAAVAPGAATTQYFADATPLAAPASPDATSFAVAPSAAAPSAADVPAGMRAIRGVTNGEWAAQQAPALAAVIARWGWVQDGLDARETGAVEHLLYMAVESRTLASDVGALPWLADGVTAVEAQALRSLSAIANQHAQAAEAVAALPWLADGVTDVEADALDWLDNFDADATSIVTTLAWLPWVRDGVDALEVTAIKRLSYVANRRPESAGAVLAMPWLQDGVTGVEAEALDWLDNFNEGSADLAASLASLPWVRDGVDGPEVTAIERLSYLAYAHPAAARRIVAMPFLRQLAPADEAALQSLAQLAQENPSRLEQVLAHPAHAGGFTDAWSPIVATLAGVVRFDPGLVPLLLDPEVVLLDTRAVTLPLAGEVQLAIVRTQPGAQRSMDLLEQLVREAEAAMGAPLPTNFVGLLFAESVLPGVAGTNFGSHIAVRPEYDVDDGSAEAESAPHTIGHEVAHYYWRGNADWLDEGAADVLASLVEERRAGTGVTVSNLPCPAMRTIAELERADPAQADPAFTCNYALGERLFVDLRRSLGPERFREAFTALYRATMPAEGVGDDATALGIADVRAAFGVDGAGATAVARWYDGAAPYDRSALDLSPPNPGFLSIQGSVTAAYVVVGIDGPPVTSFSAGAVDDWVLLTLKYTYSTQLAAEDVVLEIVESYEDGLEYGRVTLTVTAQAEFIGGTHSVSVGAPPSKDWAPGRYYVSIYDGPRKVAHVEFTVTP